MSLFSSTPEDAVDKLKADHDAVEDMLDRIKDAAPAEKLKLGVRLANMLKIHMELEEELFYPALRRHGGKKAKLDEGLVEHDTAKIIVNDVLDARNTKDNVIAKLQVLGEQMVHHQDEEEEKGGIFDQARESDLDLVAMLQKMLVRETELKAELKDDGDLPTAEPSKIHIAASE
ncbi:MAG: hemerythrin domain-containing protein [Croceibacterium sp.]